MFFYLSLQFKTPTPLMKQYLLYLLQLLLAPKQGWKDIAADGKDYEALERRGFIPFAAIAALSVFVQMIYHPGLSPVKLLIDCVIEFGAWLIGYFLAAAVMGAYLPDLCYDEPPVRRIRVFSLCSVGLLAFMSLVKNCMPGDFAIIYFLIIYLVVIMWRAADYFDVMPESVFKFTLLATACVIVPPMLMIVLLV